MWKQEESGRFENFALTEHRPSAGKWNAGNFTHFRNSPKCKVEALVQRSNWGNGWNRLCHLMWRWGWSGVCSSPGDSLGDPEVQNQTSADLEIPCSDSRFCRYKGGKHYTNMQSPPQFFLQWHFNASQGEVPSFQPFVFKPGPSLPQLLF